MREVQPFQLRYGASYDTERGVGGIFDISNHNSLGKARVVGLQSRYDGELREARLYVSQPSLRYWPLKTTANLYYREELNPPTDLTDPFDISAEGRVDSAGDGAPRFVCLELRLPLRTRHDAGTRRSAWASPRR